MSQTLPLWLSAARQESHLADNHTSEADAKFALRRAEVFERDNNTCRFCGVRANKWMEMHHLDGDHTHNAPSNLATGCCFCHQCFHLGIAGTQGGGKIVWLPEISQTDINLLCWAIFTAISTDNEWAEGAKSLYSTLESRALYLEQSLGIGASNPAAWSQELIKLGEDQFDPARKNMIEAGLRLIPMPDRFMPQIKYFTDETMQPLPPDTWERIYQQAINAE